MQNRQRWIWTGAAVLVAVAVGYVLIDRQHANPDGLLLMPGDGALVANGRALYEENCASCHGRNLEGQPNWQTRLSSGRLPAPPHDTTGHTWHHAEPLLFDLTKYGVQKFAGADYESDMPAYDGILSDEEIIAILSYIKSTWPEGVRRRHDLMTKAAAQQ